MAHGQLDPVVVVKPSSSFAEMVTLAEPKKSWAGTIAICAVLEVPEGFDSGPNRILPSGSMDGLSEVPVSLSVPTA